MPRYNGNGIYLSIDGTEVHAQFKSVNLEPSIATVDTTRGSNTEHVQRNTGLRDTAFSASIGYNTETIQTFLPLLRPGEHVIIFGPEGNGAGKPKHQQTFLFTSAPFEIAVDKVEVVFELSGEGADAPVFDMFAGAVF